MMNALYAGVSGLRSHQVRMDVIGNNIANVNTFAFKRGRASFAEQLGQQMVGAGGNYRGSVGNGVLASRIDQNWTQGAFEFTNLATDLALAGDGFFVAKEGPQTLLSRAGNFRFDADGTLVTSSGARVQGWPVQADGSVYTGTLQDVRLDLDASSAPEETTEARLAGNLSADIRAGDDDDEVTISSAIYDEQGQAHTLVLTLQKSGEDEWTLTEAELAGDPDAEPPVPATPLGGTGAVLEFDTDGTLIGPDPAEALITGVFPDSNGDDVAVTVDLEGLTQYGGSTTLAVAEQDGKAAGEILGYGFDPEGKLVLNFSNGEQRAIAQLAIGSVTNPGGLEQAGNSFFRAAQSSGDLVIGRAGQEVNTSVASGALEVSNVDLAAEFTDMIVTQRGYQASARVITTSDELLQELVQLKR